MSNFWNKDGLVVDVIKTSNGVKFITEDDVKSGVGHAVGEQWISFDGTIPEGGLPFDGQLRNVELYQQLFNWAKENGRVIDEEEWQHLRETNNGNVPYYSAGDGSIGKKAEGYIIYPISSEGTYILKIGQNLESWPLSNSGTIDELVDYINSGSFGNNLSASYVTEMYVPETTGVEEEVIKLIITSTVMSSNANLLKIGSEDGTYYEKKDFSGGKAPSESTTFRLPIFNSYFKADGVGGGYIAEGLPNITGKAGPYENSQGYSLLSEGAMEAEYQGKHAIGGGGTGSYYFAKLDASLSNPIYGNSEHVTPETSTVIVGVWVVGSYTNTSGLDMADLKEALSVANTYDSMPLLTHHWDYKGLSNAGWVRADGYWLDGDLYTDAYRKLVELDENQAPLPSGYYDGIDIVSAVYTTLIDKNNPYSFLLDKTNRKFRLPFLNKSEKLVIYKESSQVVNGASASNVYTTYYSDGTVKIEGTYDSSSSTSGTINWTVPLLTNYRAIIQDTRRTGTETDTEGWQYYAGPSAYEATSLRVSHYKASGRLLDFTIEGTPETIIIPKFKFMYFKLGNTFTNEGQMNAAEISDKIDRVWDAWQEADYVVESWEDGTEWYRLYKSGWVEQGGKYLWDGATTTPREIPITLYKEMFNTLYTVNVTSSNYTAAGYFPWVNSITTTGFILYASGTAGVRSDIFWRACGKVK